MRNINFNLLDFHWENIYLAAKQGALLRRSGKVVAEVEYVGSVEDKPTRLVAIHYLIEAINTEGKSRIKLMVNYKHPLNYSKIDYVLLTNYIAKAKGHEPSIQNHANDKENIIVEYTV